jgi:molybdopterin-guanine dinucleotide biosynthesis protein A
MNCYVLVGGASRRMGEPKEQAIYGGETFLERVVAQAAPLFESVIAVDRQIPSAARSIQTIVDGGDGAGAAYGIRAALRHGGDDAWILAVDYPALTTEVLSYLVRRFRNSESDVLFPIWDGEPQFLCAGYRLSALTTIERCIERGEVRLHRIVTSLKVTEVAEFELRSLFPGEPLRNFNSPADLVEVPPHG